MTILRTYHHPDHLGSSSWITDGSGQAIQHLHYLPFGEDWVDQRTTSWNASYTFSGKEKDVETGYGYFGARYYDSGLSIWLSVDPMSDKYPSMSPYNYCANNPVILVDPDGRSFNETDQQLINEFKNQVTLEKLFVNYAIMVEKLINGRASPESKAKLKELNDIESEIEILEGSDQVYAIVNRPSELEDNAHGSTSLNGDVIEINLRLPGLGSKEQIGTLAHELKHCFQFENKQISFNPDGTGGMLYDLTDEREAFRRGAAFGRNMPTDADIHSDYPNLPLFDIRLDPNRSDYRNTIGALNQNREYYKRD